MAWIRIIDEEKASSELKLAYEKVTGQRGKVSNVMKAQSLQPAAMVAHLDLYISLVFSVTGLKRVDRELIAVAVSRSNFCSYCVTHHAEALNHYWRNSDKVKMLTDDLKSLDLPKNQQALIDYSVKLTKRPHNMNEGDITKLRDVGYSDKAILNINMIAAYYNFVNRIVMGLGVKFDENESKGYKY